MSKYLFVVDEKNDPLPVRLDRRQAHEQGFWHRTVHIWVLNYKGQMLLVKRGEWKTHDPGLWASYIGGHCFWGETYEKTAKRETQEEIGVDIKSLSRFRPLKIVKNPGKEFTKIFLLKLKKDESIQRTPKEFTDSVFVRPLLIAIKTKTHNLISGGVDYINTQLQYIIDISKNKIE